MDQRLLNPISTRELERRWAAARRKMAERKIDALVMQNNNDWLGGNVRWFTDTPLSNGYPRSVIFPASDLMTVVDMGARGGRRKINGGDETNRGVGELIFTPAFTSVAYTDEYQAELVADELKRRGYRTIGTLAGFINGCVVVYGRIQPIIATLILMVAGRGIAQLLTGGQIITVYYAPYFVLGNGFLLPLSMSAGDTSPSSSASVPAAEWRVRSICSMRSCAVT